MTGRRHWETVYQSRPEQQLSWYQEDPQVSLNLVKNAGLDKDDPIIDVGGGASMLVDCLLERYYRDISVLDISATALQLNRDRMDQQADLVHWIASDICNFNPQRKYALWHDRALFHFLTEEESRRQYTKVMQKALTPGGQAIFATFAVEGPRQCSGLDTLRYDQDRLLEVLGPDFRLLEEAREVHETPASREQLFSYFRLVFEPGID
jgi:SAM-dependent methyltransferase